MNRSRVFLSAVVLIFSSTLGLAQDLSHYRAYALDSTLEAVLAVSGVRATDVKTLHERPAKIQELEWRAPYVSSRGDLADPVRAAVFTFHNDALYQIVISYDRGRTDGLTTDDIIESVAAVYGAPVLKSEGIRPQAGRPDTVVLAQWDSTDASLTLRRGAYSSEFQLVLTSKASSTRARTAIREAGRLDAIDAPRLELEQRQKDTTKADIARDKLRATNKAAFRP
jgi:hypothetical protein